MLTKGEIFVITMQSKKGKNPYDDVNPFPKLDENVQKLDLRYLTIGSRVTYVAKLSTMELCYLVIPLGDNSLFDRNVIKIRLQA